MDCALDELPAVGTVFFGFTWSSLTPFAHISALLLRTQKSGRLFARLDLVRYTVGHACGRLADSQLSQDELSWTETYALPVSLKTALATSAW